MKLRWPKRLHRFTRKSLELRQATPADAEPLSVLYEACMRPYAEAFYPWDHHRFLDDFDPAEIEVLDFQGRMIGLLRTKFSDEFVYLAEVQIHENHRNRGLGSELVKLTLQRAAALDLPVRLRVLRNNPALHLYERLGFEQVGEGACDLILQHPAN
ncbi:MAG: GNAT family N-acetyltransferase [Verrucomicrobiota bacterium]